MNLNELSNTALFRMYVEQGSREAISVFFQKQADLFYRVAFKYTKNSADAEDVLQSTFLKIIDKADQYKGVKSDEEKLLQSWCLSIVIQCALMDRRTDSNRRKREDFTAAQAKPFYEDENMDTNNEMKAVHQKVQNAIIQLPEKYRIPIHLKYIEGFELETIAELLKLNINTLKSNIKRGLEKVSLQLKDEKVTLSSVGLIQLMATMPVEKAPVTIQSMASNIFDVASNSRRLMASSKATSSLISVKAAAFVAVASIAVVAGVYHKEIFKSSEPTALETKIENKLPQPVESQPNIKQAKEVNINGTWMQNNQYVETVLVLLGGLQYSEKAKCIFSKKDEPVIISFPISDIKKPFVMDCLIAPYITKEINASLLFRGFWVKDNTLLRNEEWASKDQYLIKEVELRMQQIYFYENYVLVFINGKCYQVDKYSQDLSDAKVAIFSRNFMYQKVSSRELDEVPQEVKNAIENFKNQKTTIQEDWQINANKVNFKD